MNSFKGPDVTRSCDTSQSSMAEMLLDETFLEVHPEIAAHLNACRICGTEWQELRATMTALDEWQTPEPSAFFDSRLHARLREAAAAEPEGFFERVRSFVLFSTGRQLRPALAGALALILLAGGGTELVGIHQRMAASQASAAVNDLRILDNNAQALQQMDQLLDDGSSEDGGLPPTT